MCNPRKVMIHLTRSIQEAWRQTVLGAATVSEEVTELASLNAEVRLDEEMGDMALQMLERVLAGEFEGFDPWERDSLGQYRRELDEVMLIYNPDNHQLTAEAQLTQLVTAEAQGTAEASGVRVQDVTIEAVGRYYDDGWGGRTKEVALKEAEKKAEVRMTKTIEELERRQRQKELTDTDGRPALSLADAEDQAQSQAEASARQELSRLQGEVSDALRERVQIVLAQAEAQVYYVMNRAIGEAYRQSLRQLVLDSGGRVLRDEQTGSVINMELELY
jgi:hypothetical protein